MRYAIAICDRATGINAWVLTNAPGSKVAWSNVRRQIDNNERVETIDFKSGTPTGSHVNLSRAKYKVVAGKRLDDVIRDRAPVLIRALIEMHGIDATREFLGSHANEYESLFATPDDETNVA